MPAYRFDGLTAEYPFKDARGGHRYVDFTYQRGGTRPAIEIDGFSTHARDLSPGDFDDHLVRQNALTNEGWPVYRFSVRMIEREPEYYTPNQTHDELKQKYVTKWKEV